jgi:hypothetical protein
LARVDGNNNVHVDVSPSLLRAAGIDVDEYATLLRPADAWYRIKLGAAGARYLGDGEGLGEDPRRWPTELPQHVARTIVAALPHALERINDEYAAGRRVSRMVFSNDLARARGDDPVAVAVSYRASAESGFEYERRIRDIKSSDDPLVVKAERLAEEVLRFGDEVSAARARRQHERRAAQAPRHHVRRAVRAPQLDSLSDYDLAPAMKLEERRVIRRELDPIELLRASLSDAARRFLDSAELLAGLLATKPHHDWSGPIISYCKAFELEAVNRVIRPLCRELAHDGVSAADRDDKDIGKVATYCANGSGHPPELGVIAHFLRTAAHSTRRAETSPTLRTFKRLTVRWGGGWLLDDHGALKAIPELTRRFRNPAAHTGELQDEDYRDCRDFVTGPTGILWKLLSATPSQS